MDLVIKATGHRCDLALHPISPNSASIIHRLGRKLYAKKYLEWWRQGRTCTCGVRYDSACSFELCLDGACVSFDPSVIGKSAELFSKRHYLDTKVQYLALLGYEDEYCQTTWTWRGVRDFDPGKLEFVVHRWDRLLDVEDYLIIEDVLYDGRCADHEAPGQSKGFNLVDPRVIDLDEVRRGMGMPYLSSGFQREYRVS